MIGLSGDQLRVMDVLRDAVMPMTPAQVAAAMGTTGGEERTPAGAGQTLSSLHRHGMVHRRWGDTSAVYWVATKGLG